MSYREVMVGFSGYSNAECSGHNAQFLMFGQLAVWNIQLPMRRKCELSYIKSFTTRFHISRFINVTWLQPSYGF